MKKFAISGFLNGLLPCGLVFVALSSSALLTNWYDGAIYMMLFGLGTFPAMLFLSIGANTIKNKISIIRIQYFIPYVFLITGGLLLVRGLGIGIPYLSPQFVEQDQKVNCCHAK